MSLRVNQGLDLIDYSVQGALGREVANFHALFKQGHYLPNLARDGLNEGGVKLNVRDRSQREVTGVERQSCLRT